jgi:hypothetical protein
MSHRHFKLDTSVYGSLLIPILKDRLPDEVTMIISRKFGEEIWTLDTVMDSWNILIVSFERKRIVVHPLRIDLS